MNIWMKYGFLESANGEGNGLLDIAKEIKARSARGEYKAPVYINVSEWGKDTRESIAAGAALDLYEPILGVAHSYGGASMIREAKQLKDDVLFNEMIGVDVVTRLLWGQLKAYSWRLTNNIQKATFFYQRNDTTPIMSSLIRNLDGGEYENVNLSAEKVDGKPVTHTSICRSPTIREAVLAAVTYWTNHEASMRLVVGAT